MLGSCTSRSDARTPRCFAVTVTIAAGLVGRGSVPGLRGLGASDRCRHLVRPRARSRSTSTATTTFPRSAERDLRTTWHGMGMGVHAAPYGGVPDRSPRPDRYRAEWLRSRISWASTGGTSRTHRVPNPRCSVTIQQIGMHLFLAGDEARRDTYVATNPLAGTGWFTPRPPAGLCGIGLFERVDDFSAASFRLLR